MSDGSTKDPKCSSPKSKSPIRLVAKSLIARSSPKAMTLLTSSTEEEIEACYPIVDILNHVIRVGRESSENKLSYTEELQVPELQVSENNEAQIAGGQFVLRDAMLAGAFTGNLEIVDQAIRQGADILASENTGRNVLHYCATGGYHALMTKILRKIDRVCTKNDRISIKDVVNKMDNNNWTPLAIAVCRNKLGCVSVLLESGFADINHEMTHSCPPSRGAEKTKSSLLHFAAMQGNAPILKLLVDAGITVNIKDSEGRNLFHYIASMKNETQACACINTILSAEANQEKFSQMLIAPDNSNRSPLFCATTYGNADVLQAMLRYLHANNTKYSLKHEMVEIVDDWEMSAVRAAFLKRYYHVIDKISLIWPLYRNDAVDPKSLYLALCDIHKLTGEMDSPSPNLLIRRILEQSSTWVKWLKHNLTNSEKICYEFIKNMLRTQSSLVRVEDSVILRSIKRCGTDYVYQAMDHTLHSTNKNLRRDLLASLKCVLSENLPETEVQNAWRYINAESLTARKQATRNKMTQMSMQRTTTAQNSQRKPSYSPVKAGTPPIQSVCAQPRVLRAATTRHEVMEQVQSGDVFGWNDENLPSFAAPTQSVKNALQNMPEIPRIERNRLK